MREENVWYSVVLTNNLSFYSETKEVDTESEAMEFYAENKYQYDKVEVLKWKKECECICSHIER